MLSYKTNSPPITMRGAPMGRPTILPEDREVKVELFASKIRMHGDYDVNGVYFGAPRPGTSLWWIHDREGEVDLVYRGNDLYYAQQHALSYLPFAWFCRPAPMPGLRSEIEASAARAFFVSAWAQVMEDYGTREDRAWGGQDLMDIAPTTPAKVLKYYSKFIREFELLNSPYTLDEIWEMARTGEGHRRSPRMDDFGHCLAMEAMGSGVCWWDDHPRFQLPARGEIIEAREMIVPSWEGDCFYRFNLERTLPAKVRRAFMKGEST